MDLPKGWHDQKLKLPKNDTQKKEHDDIVM